MRKNTTFFSSLFLLLSLSCVFDRPVVIATRGDILAAPRVASSSLDSLAKKHYYLSAPVWSAFITPRRAHSLSTPTSSDSSLYISQGPSIHRVTTPALAHNGGHVLKATDSDAPQSSVDHDEGWRGAKSWSLSLHEARKPIMDIEAIKRVIPHRYPFLLVDKVIDFQPGKRIIGVKQVTSNEPHFNGHFPTRAIMPGVLQVEALAQLGGLLCLQLSSKESEGESETESGGESEKPSGVESPPVNFLFASVNGVKWKKPVVPGDSLVMEMGLDAHREKLGIVKMSGSAYVNGEMVIDVKEFTFAITKG